MIESEWFKQKNPQDLREFYRSSDSRLYSFYFGNGNTLKILKVREKGEGEFFSSENIFEKEKQKIELLNKCEYIHKVEALNLESSMKCLLIIMDEEKTNLHTDLQKLKALEKHSLQRFMTSIFKSLCFAHDKNIAHKNLKLSNVLISHNGDYLLSDWGLTEEDYNDENIRLQRAKSPICPPEQPKSLDEFFKADVYSFGILILLCMGMGMEQIGEQLDKENKEKHCHGLEKLLESQQKAFPEYTALVRGMCKFDPQERMNIFTGARDFARICSEAPATQEKEQNQQKKKREKSLIKKWFCCGPVQKTETKRDMVNKNKVDMNFKENDYGKILRREIPQEKLNYLLEFIEFESALKQMKDVKKNKLFFDFKWNFSIDSDAIHHLSRRLFQFDSLIDLHFYCSLTAVADEGILSLASAVSQLTLLERLGIFMGKTKVTNNSIMSISGAIKELKSLKTLQLCTEENNISDEGIIHLAESIKEHLELEEFSLYISGTKVTDNGIIALCDSLKSKKGSTTFTIEFKSTKVGDRGLEYLAKCLRELPSLKNLIVLADNSNTTLGGNQKFFEEFKDIPSFSFTPN